MIERGRNKKVVDEDNFYSQFYFNVFDGENSTSTFTTLVQTLRIYFPNLIRFFLKYTIRPLPSITYLIATSDMYIYAISHHTPLYIPIARFKQKELHTLGRPNLPNLLFCNSFYVNYTPWRLFLFLTFVCFFCKCETFLFGPECRQLMGIGQNIIYL